jgi:hypothetical protein
MKFSRSEIHRKTHRIPSLRFEDQQLTSFSGLVLFQGLFAHLGLLDRLRQCFRHLGVSPIFGYAKCILLLVVHLLLGYRELRDIRYYADDPLVKRVLGLRRLPDVATLSRALAGADAESVRRLAALLREMVLQRLVVLGLERVTLDFDGSVIGTSRFAEGTAVGFNRRKKGQRSYYPLFCTVAQTAQVLAALHRSGNVHDSNGAEAFIRDCIRQVRAALPGVLIEVRADSAFFSDSVVGLLQAEKVHHTLSVPFERWTELKQRIETCQRWLPLDEEVSYFEAQWKPKSWHSYHRFLFIRKTVRQQYKGPVQLDLFIPYEYGYEFKVIVTNQPQHAAEVVAFHNGRGAQEGLFAELKSDNQLDYVPTRTWVGNQIYLLSTLLAHNLSRELQMIARPIPHRAPQKRPALWDFARLNTLRCRLIQRAGRLIRPQGRLTLSMSANSAVQQELLHYLEALQKAA